MVPQGVRRLWTRWVGRVPVLTNPANGNRAVPLTYEQSRDGFANAAAEQSVAPLERSRQRRHKC